MKSPKKSPKFLYTSSAICLFVMVGCAGRVLKYEHQEQLKDNKEFEQVVKIEPQLSTPAATALPIQAATIVAAQPKNKSVPKKPQKLKPVKEQKTLPIVVQRRQPELESDVGFVGRRPLKDPFLVGEKVVHKVNYFKVSAGTLTMEVKPFVTVNGRKSYNFRTAVSTSPLFASFYSAEDNVETLVDFENLVPNVFTLHIQETGQLREARSFFDHVNRKAMYWEKKVTEKDGKQEKKLEWELEDYSQNVFSAAFYLRNFHWALGVENAFRMSDNGENLNFRAKAIRQEQLETEVGVFDTIVIKPEIELRGVFRPVGDIYVWLSNDDRKYILRIESKIKIGTLVSEVIELAPGSP